MKKAFKTISIFAVIFLALILGAGCDVDDKDENTFSIWITPKQGTSYWKYALLSTVDNSLQTEGYIGHYFDVLDKSDGAVASFKVSGSRVTITLFDGQSIITGFAGYWDNVIEVRGEKTSYSNEKPETVGYIGIYKIDKKYKLTFTPIN